MPLNKLENFVKNTEGRILYVNPNDLDSTDAITNQGNSLTQPFKTIQRALLESARFSYLKGNNNDIVEKTTILVYPGDHIIDNRPGFAIKSNNSNQAIAVSPSGGESSAQTTLTLDLSSNFDLTQEDNILYKFNSIHGGVVVPRGTSIVGLDLRKTKIKPKYVPNPTDSLINAPKSAIFRVTGSCYFWQFSIFDGDETGLVYTDPVDFSSNNQSTPNFSHHKLTCFEYADGITKPSGYTITDLDMYYSKLSNAFNLASTRDIDQKYPSNPDGFAKQRPEWEIVGAFATDPFDISSIVSGDGSTPGTLITVTTTGEHGFTSDTPIKIKGVATPDYNISTKVNTVLNTTQFTYLLPFVRPNLPATPAASGATVTIETDTVSGASPYIFNCSMRSVWGMNGLLADGKKSSGFKSMVIAQFTGVSLQKDDRAFVKYNETSRLYEGITVGLAKGANLTKESSSLDAASVYHLDTNAVYRTGWETSHLRMENDATLQIVSVFAIGFNQHFDARSGSDASVTNSNSNFGQISLSADGFKKTAFSKDNNAFVTNVITPKAISGSSIDVEWQSLDVGLTTAVGISSHLYLYGWTDQDSKPPTSVQGYRLGAKSTEKLYLDTGTVKEASVAMVDNVVSSASTIALGSDISSKVQRVQSGPTFVQNNAAASNIFNIGTHEIQTGERIRILSDDGDLPENIEPNVMYYAIRKSSTEIKIASSLTNAENDSPITVYGGTKLYVESRVSDKSAGDIGSPLQWDSIHNNWFIHSTTSNDIYTDFASQGVAGIGAVSNISYITRIADPRSLDEKIYKMRVVIPKELINSKDPNEGFVIQDSSSTGARSNADFGLTSLTTADYGYDKNPRFISTCSASGGTVSVRSELPHNLNLNDQIIVTNVQSTTNTVGAGNSGYNGTFTVSQVTNAQEFQYSTTDTDGDVHNAGDFTNDTASRTTALPRFSRNDLQSNYYIYRNEVITPYIYNVQDGIYHLYVLKADQAVPTEFTGTKYGQNVVDLYPQHDKDNENDNPTSSVSFAKRSPLGDVETSDLKKSITREAADKFVQDFGVGLKITGVDATTSGGVGVSTITFDRAHGFSGIVTYTTLTGGSGYTNGTYQNVKLFNDGTTTWDGATARVTVAGGAVTNAEIISGGSGYGAETLDFDPTFIGGGTGAEIAVTTAGITTNIGDVLQITGIGTATDGYYRILSVPSTVSVALTTSNGDPTSYPNQYAVNIGPSVAINSDDYESVSGISTFTCASAHGLVSGSGFRVIGSNNANLGDFLVKERVGVNTFSAKTSANLAGAFVLPLGFAAADATSDVSGENLGARGISFYEGDTLTLGSNITNETSIVVSSPSAGIGTAIRYSLGSYIQIDSEMMRVVSSSLTGAGLNEISVIRGTLGTTKANHSSGSLIKKVKPLPIEFRRPSIIRSSGHTFEYVGYGPGNYSTGLPQVQTKTLSEREEFLVQSQERSCGTVVYTGMNNDGDFFIGNKRVSSATGTEQTFDAPIPTVTGEDPSRLSVVFDEVVIKERLTVEGGTSGTILTQFDGPVTFSKDVRTEGNATFTKIVNISDNTQSTSITTGALTVKGGVGIGSNLNVGGDFNVTGTLNCTTVEFGNIKVAQTDDNTIDTKAGNLKLDSTSGTVEVNDNLTVVGVASVTGNVNLGNATSDATTVAGTLAVNSTTNSTSKTTGALTVAGGVGINNDLHVGGDITAFASSDKRLKDNLTPIEDPLAKVLSISGNTFNWNGASKWEGKADTGVIAQEIEALGLPGLTDVRDDGTKAVNYEKLAALLIEAVKELSAKVDTLTDK